MTIVFFKMMSKDVMIFYQRKAARPEPVWLSWLLCSAARVVSPLAATVIIMVSPGFGIAFAALQPKRFPHPQDFRAMLVEFNSVFWTPW